MTFNYLFGPIPSRRLGISLGVDLVPHKICNLNCVYCESGKTTLHTTVRKDYIPENSIITELNTYLKDNPKLDYITFSGAGEPTLHSGIGNILKFLKSNYPGYKTALITNSLLFENRDVRKEIKPFHLILPSLDAASQEVFQSINRPYKGILVSNIINGLIEFNKSYKGQLWLEYFVLPGLNDTDNELKLLKSAFQKIKPTKLQLNSLDRPGTVSGLVPASYERLVELKDFFQPIPTDIISRSDEVKHLDHLKQDIHFSILQAVSRRPCSINDLSQILSLSSTETKAHIDFLLELKEIREEVQNGVTFYCIP